MTSNFYEFCCHNQIPHKLNKKIKKIENYLGTESSDVKQVSIFIEEAFNLLSSSLEEFYENNSFLAEEVEGLYFEEDLAKRVFWRAGRSSSNFGSFVRDIAHTPVELFAEFDFSDVWEIYTFYLYPRLFVYDSCADSDYRGNLLTPYVFNLYGLLVELFREGKLSAREVIAHMRTYNDLNHYVYIDIREEDVKCVNSEEANALLPIPILRSVDNSSSDKRYRGKNSYRKTSAFSVYNKIVSDFKLSDNVPLSLWMDINFKCDIMSRNIMLTIVEEDVVAYNKKLLNIMRESA